MSISSASAAVLTILGVLAGGVALAYAVARGLPARDFRPGLAALVAGFVAANVAFILLALDAVEAPALSVVWSGGFAMLFCSMWHVTAPRSWHVVWDAFVRLSRRIHPLGSLVFLVTLCVTISLLVLRIQRALPA